MGAPKVLIIDDSPAECIVMATALQGAGYELSTALDGRSGLSLALSLRPQCLILDIVLPGMNGYDVCRQLRIADPQHMMPIILVSTKNTPLDRTYGLRLGADWYLPKPFSGEELVKTVWDVLPPRYRPLTTSLKPVQVPRPVWESLIPRRRESSALFATSNPFARSSHVDRLTRHLLVAIDGHRTVPILCRVTGFDTQVVVKMLEMLLEQQLIEFYDQQGYVFEGSPF